MKDKPKAKKILQTPKLGKTRSGSRVKSEKPVHQRGDKVVVNGAKESLMAILRRYMCSCGRHSLEKATSKFLTLNKVSASYDLVVWMFIYMRTNCQTALYEEIANQYLMKMNKKRDEGQTHHSVKYIQSKKFTLQRFILSAQMLLVATISSKSIQNSVSVLYSKGKSKDDAVKKVVGYLNKVNQRFYQCDELQFQRTSACSFMKQPSSGSSSSNSYNEPSLISTLIANENNLKRDEKQSQPNNVSFQKQQEDTLSSFSSQIYQNDQQPFPSTISWPENPVLSPSLMPKDQPNKSYRQSLQHQSFDLFDELILDESVDSPNSSYHLLYYFTN